MALFRESAGLVGIATGGESTYGTPDTITHVLYCDSAAYAMEPQLFDYGSVATGYEESIGNVITRMMTRINLTGPLCDKSAPILLSLALGGDTKSTVDTSATQHLITPVGATTELPSTTIQINTGSPSDTTHGAKFAGCVLDSLTISAQNNGTWTYNASFVTEGIDSGSLADLSAMTAPTVLPFLWGKTFVKWRHTLETGAPSFDAPNSSADPTGGWTTPVNISAGVTSYSYTINNGARLFSTTASDGSTTKAVRTKRSQTLTLGLMFDSTTLATAGIQLVDFGGKTGGQAKQISLLMQNLQPVFAGSTYYHSLTQYFNKLSLQSVTPPVGNPREFSTTWGVNATATTESSYHYCVNADNVDYC